MRHRLSERKEEGTEGLLIKANISQIMFKPYTGRWKVQWLPVTVSTAISANALVGWSSGYLVAMTSSAAAATLAGINVKAIAATDADYATARKVPVLVPADKNAECRFVTTGLVVTDIGTIADLTDSLTVDRSASTYDIVKITRRFSATEGAGVLQVTG